MFAYDVVRTEVRVDARAVDTSTGRLTFTESAEGTSEAKIVTDARGRMISGALDLDAELDVAQRRFRRPASVRAPASGRRQPVTARRPPAEEWPASASAG